MPATRLSNMLAATTMLLGVRLDKMLKLTLLRGGPAKPTNIAATEHNQSLKP